MDPEFPGFQTSFQWLFNTYYSKHYENTDYISIIVGGKRQAWYSKLFSSTAKLLCSPKKAGMPKQIIGNIWHFYYCLFRKELIFNMKQRFALQTLKTWVLTVTFIILTSAVKVLLTCVKRWNHRSWKAECQAGFGSSESLGAYLLLLDSKVVGYLTWGSGFH